MKKYIANVHNKKALLIFFCFSLLIIIGCGGNGNNEGNGAVARTDEIRSDTPSPPEGPPPEEAPPAGLKSVQLQWVAPTTNDGPPFYSPLSDLAGYVIYYGPGSNNYTQFVTIGKNTSSVISDLTPGKWCFVVKAYDYSGNKSNYSEEVCTTI